MVSRDHGLMRTCSNEWMRCCDAEVPRLDGVVRAGARKYFSGWRSKISCLVSGPFIDGGKYQLVHNHWEKSGKTG